MPSTWFFKSTLNNRPIDPSTKDDPKMDDLLFILLYSKFRFFKIKFLS